MGFLSFVGSCFKAVGNFCSNVVSTVSNAVTTVVKAVAEPVIKVANAVLAPVKKLVSVVTEKLSEAKDWFVEKTWIGQKINQGYEFIMENTGLRTGINWAKEKVSSAKQWFDNTAVGKCVNSVMPLVNIAGLALGGLPALIANGYTAVNSTVNAVINSNPLDIVKDLMLNNSLTQGAKNWVQKGTDYVTNSPVGKFVREKIQTVKSFTDDTIEKGKNTFNSYLQTPQVQKALRTFDYAKQTALKYGIQYAPRIVQTGKQLYQKGRNIYEQLEPQVQRLYQQNIGSTEYGRKINKGIDAFRKYAYNPAQQYIYPPCKTYAQKFWDVAGRPLTNKMLGKIENTNFYQINREKLRNSFERFERQKRGFMKFQSQEQEIQNVIPTVFSEERKIIKNSEFAPILRSENRKDGMDSSTFMASYLSKFGGEQRSIQKFKDKFISVGDYFKRRSLQLEKNVRSQGLSQNPEQECTLPLNSLVDSGKVKIQSLSFNHDTAAGKSHTIDGMMKLRNITNENLKFQVIQGQMFGCSIPRTSQHTVVRGLKCSLKPYETKQISLEAFCGDSGLRWPHGDNNFTMTNYLVKKFTNDQSSQWAQINY